MTKSVLGIREGKWEGEWEGERRGCVREGGGEGERIRQSEKDKIETERFFFLICFIFLWALFRVGNNLIYQENNLPEQKV